MNQRRTLLGKRRKFNGSKRKKTPSWSKIAHSFSKLIGIKGGELSIALLKSVGEILEVLGLMDLLQGNRQRRHSLAKAYSISHQRFVEQAQSMIKNT